MVAFPDLGSLNYLQFQLNFQSSFDQALQGRRQQVEPDLVSFPELLHSIGSTVSNLK